MKAKSTYAKVEFWIATIVAAAILMGLLINSKNHVGEPYGFHEHHVAYNYYKHFFLPRLAQVILFYCAFIYLTRFVEEKNDDWTKAGNVFGIYLVVATIFSIIATYISAWKFNLFNNKDDFYTDVFTDGFTTVAIIYIIYIGYYVLKQIIFNAVANRSFKISKKRKVSEIALAIGCYVALIGVSLANNSPEAASLFSVAIPYAALIVFLHIKFLIPLAGARRFKSRAYIWRVLPIVFLLSLLAAALTTGMAGGNDVAAIWVMYLLFTFFLIIPAAWYISKNKKDKDVLQTALGSSQANLSFLRSQINPHFLFNALNTLYGTALQENAERTGEGIQKLGDMMRFMLHENMQDKISLAREVEYLNNYIDLQKLRTATSTNIAIQTNIEQQLNPLHISPMLLIPFIENAFKHGISLQQPSFINTSLHTKENVLYFDVHNSVHFKNEYDPEKMKSGIGLQNVKQRLALLYPNKHELIIRESAKEFFVHLTIHL